jgi:hypothetical protein
MDFLAGAKYLAMSPPVPETSLTAFAGFRRVASGTRDELLIRLRDLPPEPPAFVFDDATGERLDLDLRGTGASAPAPVARSVGRPRLGVVAREVTLLPRHWEWLGRQPGGASVALRKLIDEARRGHADRDLQRASREASYRFMTAIAGDLPKFEEATRALFAGRRGSFESLVADWPQDLREHLRKLSAQSWGESS